MARDGHELLTQRKVYSYTQIVSIAIFNLLFLNAYVLFLRYATYWKKRTNYVGSQPYAIKAFSNAICPVNILSVLFKL